MEQNGKWSQLAESEASLPRLLQAVSNLLGDPDQDIHSVVRLLRSDARLSAEIISCCNRAGGARRVHVDDLFGAVAHLGYSQVLDILTEFLILDPMVAFRLSAVETQGLAGPESEPLSRRVYAPSGRCFGHAGLYA